MGQTAQSLLRRVATLAAGLALAGAAAAQTVGTTVRISTDKGPIDVQLYDSAAPATVTNFLNYVRRGAYDGVFFHRLSPGFVLQGGGFKFSDSASPRVSAIAQDPPVVNEFSATRSNVRGTIAMAKLGGNPNSATNQWFINLTNNAANLDGQNGGFTVFGRISTPSMAAVDALAALNTVNAAGCTNALGGQAGAMGELPLIKALSSLNCDAIRAENLVVMRTVKELPKPSASSDSDRVFNYLEAAYPQYAAPASAPTLSALGYTYRYYANTQAYVGTKDGMVFYLVPAISPNITPLAPVAELLQQAASAGY